MKGALFAILASIVASGGCATTNTNTTAPTSGPPGMQQPAQTAADDDIVCTEVQRPGSMLTHKECQSRAQADADREQMRNMMSSPKSSRDYGSTLSPGSMGNPSGR